MDVDTRTNFLKVLSFCACLFPSEGQHLELKHSVAVMPHGSSEYSANSFKSSGVSFCLVCCRLGSTRSTQ